MKPKVTYRRPRMFSSFLISILLLSVIASAQDAAPKETSGNSAHDALISAVKAGNLAAIQKAGESGDKTFVPALRNELKSTESAAAAARNALAKLGDEKALNDLTCAVYRGDRSATTELERLGGYSAISAFSNMLDNRPANQPLGQSALHELAILIPQLPLSEIERAKLHIGTITPEETFARIQHWLADHRAELSKLSPTESSRKVAPRDCWGHPPQDAGK